MSSAELAAAVKWWRPAATTTPPLPTFANFDPALSAAADWPAIVVVVAGAAAAATPAPASLAVAEGWAGDDAGSTEADFDGLSPDCDVPRERHADGHGWASEFICL